MTPRFRLTANFSKTKLKIHGLSLKSCELTGDAEVEPVTPGEQENDFETWRRPTICYLAVTAFPSPDTGDRFRTKKQACVRRKMFKIHEPDMTSSGVLESIRNGLIPFSRGFFSAHY